jgi:nudix-type nucleoside diphosphatase (YffH/AdpP family)
MRVEIKGTDQVYKGWTTLSQLTLTDGTNTFTREVEHHGSAVAVLPYDPERRRVLLVSMPRAPVLLAAEPDLLEPPAGLIDPGEDLETCARREAGEEVGVRLTDLEFVGTFWTCPGISTERLSLFLAPYRSDDKVGPGGGLADENENITVVELPLAEMAAMAAAGRLSDLKTFTLFSALQQRHPALFE